MPERDQIAPPGEAAADGTAMEKQPVKDKYRRIAVGATIAGVLLVFFLLVILVVQIVQLSVKAAEDAELKRLCEEKEQQIEEGELDLEYFLTDEALYRLALQRGWKSGH